MDFSHFFFSEMNIWETLDFCLSLLLLVYDFSFLHHGPDELLVASHLVDQVLPPEKRKNRKQDWIRSELQARHVWLSGS